MQDHSTSEADNNEIGEAQCPVVSSAQTLMLIVLMCEEKEPDTKAIRELAIECLQELEVDSETAAKNGKALLARAESAHPPVEGIRVSGIAQGLEILVEHLAGYYDVDRWPQSPVAAACRGLAVARTRLLQIA
jgi:hypothetical protein